MDTPTWNSFHATTNTGCTGGCFIWVLLLWSTFILLQIQGVIVDALWVLLLGSPFILLHLQGVPVDALYWSSYLGVPSYYYTYSVYLLAWWVLYIDTPTWNSFMPLQIQGVLVGDLYLGVPSYCYKYRVYWWVLYMGSPTWESLHTTTNTGSTGGCFIWVVLLGSPFILLLCG